MIVKKTFENIDLVIKNPLNKRETNTGDFKMINHGSNGKHNPCVSCSCVLELCLTCVQRVNVVMIHMQ